MHPNDFHNLWMVDIISSIIATISINIFLNLHIPYLKFGFNLYVMVLFGKSTLLNLSECHRIIVILGTI